MSDEGMDKYGVQLDETKTKEASEGHTKGPICPICSSRLDSGGACPRHGTKPFEARPKR
jgi:tRNA(Ile2) C34 agmatinyltransferase TiaS